MAVNHLVVGSNPTRSDIFKCYDQRGVVVTFQSHNLKLVGSIPASGNLLVFIKFVFLAQLDRATVF